jgi:ferredoxin
VTGEARVVVDAGKCRGYGLCMAIQPDVFDVPAASSTVVLLRAVVGADDIEDVEEAVRACPAQALTLRRAGER